MLRMSDHDEFIREFLEESAEGLDQLDLDLVALEHTPQETKLLQRVFRTIHTIKGTSGFFGFSKLGALAHDGESLLSLLRDGRTNYRPELASALLRLVDAIRQILSRIEKNGREGDGDYRAVSVELLRLTSQASSLPIDHAPSPTASTAASSATARQDVEPLPREMAKHDQPASNQQPSNQQPSVPPAIALPVEIAAIHASSSDHLAAADKTADAALVAERVGSPPDDALASTVTETAVTELAASASVPEVGDATTETSIRVDVRLLDQLMDLAGELVLSRNLLSLRSRSMNDPALEAATQRLSQVTTQLQDRIMKTRLQPIGSVLSKFRRIVRDLSIACGKQVDLHMQGLETELDRSLLDAIRDPLTHLVRNSIDHGLETPAERTGAGKGATGNLWLDARPESGHVLVEIRDDGRGIDVQRVRSKAIEKGLITAERAASMTSSQLVQLIFLPGFSTAAQVSDISGRGVGMDVVRTNIERIGGTVDVQTQVGRGTTIRITIPLTLAILPVLIVRSGDRLLAIPQSSLQEVVTLSEERIEYFQKTPVFRLRGNLLPLVDLDTLLQRVDLRPSTELRRVLILTHEGTRFGLCIDDIDSSEEIVVKPIASALKAIGIYAGATVLGDGAIALILDPSGIARRAGIRGQEGPSHTPAEVAPTRTVVQEPSLLICQLLSQRRVAIPLDAVERLEELHSDRIENGGGRLMVQYRGGIMPLLDLSAILEGQSMDPTGTFRVVVHERASQPPVGILVPKVVEVLRPEGPLRPIHATGPIRHVAVADGMLVDVLDMNAMLEYDG
jgi:two-component system, chemotaxis family, sensor kinase CheA